MPDGGLPEGVREAARNAGTLAAHALALDPFRPGEWLRNGQRLLAEVSADAAAELAYSEGLAAGKAEERARVTEIGRLMEARYTEHVAGQSPVATAGCVCHFCEFRREVLSKALGVEP